MKQLDLIETNPEPASPESRGTPVKLRYAEGDGKTLTAFLIYAWNRGDIAAPVMSASSGPKDYTKNEIWQLFETARHVNRIAMMRGRGPTFYLFRHDSGQWFDNTGKQVIEA